jgi:hypothetical protein
MGNGDGVLLEDEPGGDFDFILRSALAERIFPTNFRNELPMAFPIDFFFGGNVCVCIELERGMDDGGELKRVF